MPPIISLISNKKESRKPYKKASCFLRNYSAQKLNTDLRRATFARLLDAVDLARLATRFALEATRFLLTAALLVVLFFIVFSL